MSRKTENKIIVDGVNVSFYFKREQAIADALRLTISLGQVHEETMAYHAGVIGGYLVHNTVTNEYIDVNGKLPENVIDVLKGGTTR